ncbi:MAG: hypothetical protein AAFX05_02360, partial [Planctomycetota bacterium]
MMNRRCVMWAAAVLLAVAPMASGATRVGYMTLKGGLVERERTTSLLASAPTPTLRGLLESLGDLAERDDLEGLVIRMRSPILSRTQIEEIGAAIEVVRASGKHV